MEQQPTRKMISLDTLDFVRLSTVECIGDNGFIERNYPIYTPEEVDAIMESNIYEELG